MIFSVAFLFCKKEWIQESVWVYIGIIGICQQCIVQIIQIKC